MSDQETRSYPNVLRYIRERPWAITEQALGVVQEVVAAHLAGWRPTAEEQERIETMAAARPKPYAAGTGGAIAVIPLQGLLVPRASLFSAMSGGTSMDSFRAMVSQAVNDPSVSHVVLDIDSPGGVVDQIPETAAFLRAAREQKPITAVANCEAGSAAFWLACQATDFSITPSGSAGSLGVLTGHQDVSGAAEKAGVKTTLVAAAASPYKLELSPFAPLSAEARANLQAEVDDLCAWFINDVALGRGIDPETVAETFGKGRMVNAKSAVAARMADRVETLPAAIERVARTASGGYATQRAALKGFPPEVAAAIAAGDITIGARTLAGPIAPHSTPVVDAPWDAEAVEKALPADDQQGWKTVYAWFDSNGADPDDDGLPDAKADWKFPHHTKVDGPANIDAVRNGLARLTDSKIPEGDKPGVKAHLQRHLDDFNAKSHSTSLVPDAYALLERPGFREAYSNGR